MSRLLITLLCVAHAFAAPVTALCIELGGAVEVGSSSLIGEPPPDSIYKAGMSTGIVLMLDVEIATGVAFSFQPGYARTSGQIKFLDPEPPTDLHFDSVEIPALVRVYANEKKFRPYVLAGVGIGVPVSAGADEASGERDLLDELESVHLQAKFGAGLRIPVWSNGLLVEARYTQAITNITRSEALADGERFKATSFKLWIGYAFEL